MKTRRIAWTALGRLIAAGAVLLAGAEGLGGLWPDWGPVHKGLRLGIAAGGVDRKAKRLKIVFAIKNTSKRPQTIVERLSCSGHDHFWLRLRRGKRVIEPRRAVKSCRKNIPIFRTIKPGGMVVFTISFPLGAERGAYEAIGGGSVRLEDWLPGRERKLTSRPLPIKL